MRRRFMFASALATLTVCAPAAFAQTTVSDERTTPIATSTAGSGGGADSIVISNTGRVTLTSPATPAVTMDSDNDVTIDGDVTVTSDDDGGVGVNLLGGVSGDLRIGGDITVTAENLPGDDDNDGDVDGDIGAGSHRVGVLVDGTGAYVGDVFLETGGTISVRGNESAGLRTLTEMTGNIDIAGSIGTVGHNSYGVDIAAALTGDFNVSGNVATSGEGSTAIRIGGDITGGFYFNGTSSTTGFRFAGRPVTDTQLTNISNDDNPGEDTAQSGATILVEASVSGGILFDAPTDDNSTTSASAISIRGSAPAVQISATSGDIVIGESQQPAIPDDPDTTDTDESVAAIPLGFSFVNRGAITSRGELDDMDAFGVRVGGTDNGAGGFHTATLTHGMSNTGTVTAAAHSNTVGASAYAYDITSGALIPVFSNSGNISGQATTVAQGTAFADSYAIYIHSDAVMNALVNSGNILSSGIGGGSAFAVVDRSGTLTNITNSGTIQSARTAPSSYFDDNGDLVSPDDVNNYDVVAIDVSNNTTGVTYHQFWVRDVVEDDPDTDADESLNAILVTQAIIATTGDILLGSGDDVIRIDAGDVRGMIAFGDGSDMFVLDGSDVRDEITNLVTAGRIDALSTDELYDALPSFVGAVTDADGTLDIDMQWASLELTQAGELQIGDARFGDGALLRFEIDADAAAPRTITASGDVNFEAGSRLSITLSNLIGESGDYVVLSAANLDIDEGIATLADAPNPFLYDTTLALDENNSNAIILSLRRKSAEELGMNDNQAAAYGAAFAGWQANDELGAAIASLITEAEFYQAYNQLLPEYASSAIQFAMAANDSSLGALATRLEAARRSPDNTGGLWLQEFGYFADRAGTAFGPGYRGHGLGMAIGFDRPFGPFYAVGINAVGAASEVEEVEGFDNPMSAITSQIGVYAAAQTGDVYIDIYAGGGIDKFEHNRQVVIGSFSAEPIAEWDGYHLTGSARIGYDVQFGRYFFRPSASIDYLSLTENSYNESGGGAGIDLMVGDRDSTSFTGTALLSMGARFEGDDNWWSPTLRLGYRSELDSSNTDTFAALCVSDCSGTPTYSDRFTLRSQQMPGSGFIFGFGIAAGSDYSTFSLDYDADVRDDFIRHTARFVIRLVF
ncbi:autotransporter domain-containing protein [Maricaulis sp. MIT060901]|uniref:autotransporter family protein n=1 Tax=Maricaulis sp. MIT060901 TaxID=3096993 RepID=UPI00399A0E46